MRRDISLTRRRILGAGLLSLAGCGSLDRGRPDVDRPTGDERIQSILRETTTIDLHSHAGRVIAGRSGNFERPFEPVREPMSQGGMNLICLAVVADTPVTRVNADHTISAVRTPSPGELYEYAQHSFPRAMRLVEHERLALVTDRDSMAKVRKAGPAVIMASEGADFLEGQIDRVDEFYARFSLRHMQLTHYRVNELGDIQTVPEISGGLSAFGADVIRRCNALGIVVDVAHGPFDLVQRAAEVTTKPLVLSHTSLAAVPRPFSRLIGPDHARIIASTGGVIGIWPPASRFPTMTALAGGIAAMVDVVGVEHVGLGTDMLGLTGPAVFGSYTDLPVLIEALLARGFSSAEVSSIVGGNYRRVFDATMVS